MSMYLILKVPEEATSQQIKESYRRLIRTHHPDVAEVPNPGWFSIVQEAYETLGNPESRKEYDEMLSKMRVGAVRKPLPRTEVALTEPEVPSTEVVKVKPQTPTRQVPYKKVSSWFDGNYRKHSLTMWGIGRLIRINTVFLSLVKYIISSRSEGKP